MPKYRVILAWGQADEGNYCDVFEAPNEEAAKRLCAEAMLDCCPDVYDDQTPEEREQWIVNRIAECDDISISRELERPQAADIVAQLNELRTTHVSAIKAIGRKRSWRPAERAMATAERQIKLQKIEALQNVLRDAYDLSN